MDNAIFLNSALSSLGISDLDAKIYLLLVQNGPMPVSGLARYLSVERPTVYSALERLKGHGLVPVNRTPHQQYVQVEPPTRVIAMIEKQRSTLAHIQDQIELVLPELQATFTAKSKQSAFRIFEGREQFLSVYEEVLKEAKDEILYYGDAESFIKYEGVEYERRWARRRIARNLSIRILILKTGQELEIVGDNKRKLRSTRYIPAGDIFQSSYMIYGGKTLLWNPVADRAIIVDDPIMTDMFRSTFELVWRQAGKKC